MKFFDAFIRALIYLGFLAIIFYITVWFLDLIGLNLPREVITILKGIFVLVGILVLVRLFYPWVSSFSFFPPNDPPAKT